IMSSCFVPPGASRVRFLAPGKARRVPEKMGRISPPGENPRKHEPLRRRRRKGSLPIAVWRKVLLLVGGRLLGGLLGLLRRLLGLLFRLLVGLLLLRLGLRRLSGGLGGLLGADAERDQSKGCEGGGDRTHHVDSRVVGGLEGTPVRRASEQGLCPVS